MKTLRLHMSIADGYSVYLEENLLYGPDDRAKADDALMFCGGFTDKFGKPIALEISVDYARGALYEQGASAARQQKLHSVPTSEAGEIDLDDLQREVKALLRLLEHRYLGLATWNESLRERLQSLHELTSRALIVG